MRRFGRQANEQNLTRSSFDQPRLGFENAAALRPGGHRQHGEIGFRGKCFGDAILIERRRNHEQKIIGLGQGIEHMRKFMNIWLGIAANPQKMKPRRRIAANHFGE